jgi:hypothetical protein
VRAGASGGGFGGHRAAREPLRSLLTMLGVIIGVAAVVMLVAIGTGAKQYVEGQVEGPSAPTCCCRHRARSPSAAPDLVPAHASPTRRHRPIAATRSGGRDRDQAGETLRAGEQSLSRPVQGVTGDRSRRCFVRPVARGEFLSRSDVDTRRRVAVLGSSAADQLVPRPGRGRPPAHRRRRAVPGGRRDREDRLGRGSPAPTPTSPSTSRSPPRSGCSAPTGSTGSRSRLRTGPRSASSATGSWPSWRSATRARRSPR